MLNLHLGKGMTVIVFYPYTEVCKHCNRGRKQIWELGNSTYSFKLILLLIYTCTCILEVIPCKGKNKNTVETQVKFGRDCSLSFFFYLFIFFLVGSMIDVFWGLVWWWSLKWNMKQSVKKCTSKNGCKMFWCSCQPALR